MSGKKPEYLKLYETLREEIVSGAWAQGARLPSRRQLAGERGLSVVTVEHSLELLCQEGYVESRPRSGYYVIYRDGDGFANSQAGEAAQTYRDGDGFANSQIGELTQAVPQVSSGAEGEGFPFSVMARVMRRVLTEYGERIMEKPPNKGCLALREAIARYLARNRGMKAEVGQIVIGSGAEYLYGLVVELLGNTRVYATEFPSYAKIEQVYRARGVACEALPLGRDGIISQALWDSMASVLHITPFRSFPTGVTATASKRREYLRWASEGGRFIVEDDFESEFSLLRKPEETVFSLSRDDNVIYLNTFSRTVSPSLRVGYMVLPERLVPAFEAEVGFYSCTVPAFEQLVLAELIDGGDFERHVNRIRRRRRLGSRE